MATSTSALDVVDGEVREVIHRRRLDLFPDPGPVRVLVRDVVPDYSKQSLTSALPPIADSNGVVCDELDRVAGFGLLQRWLDEPEVEANESTAHDLTHVSPYIGRCSAACAQPFRRGSR